MTAIHWARAKKALDDLANVRMGEISMGQWNEKDQETIVTDLNRRLMRFQGVEVKDDK